MKKLGILMLMMLMTTTLIACGDEEDSLQASNQNQSAEANDSAGEQEDVIEAADDIDQSDIMNVDDELDEGGDDELDEGGDNELAGIPEVTDADWEAVPEGALAVPLAQLHEHELYVFFEDNEWQLCHLTGDCVLGVFQSHDGDEPWIHILGDVLHFRAEFDRVLNPLLGGEIAECRTNDKNNLLICEGVDFSEGVILDDEGLGMFGGFDSEATQEMIVRLTEATTFEIMHTDGHNSTTSQGTRNDFDELVSGTSTSYSLSIKHEEVGGELIATHIQMMIFPW